jgi:transaldolase/glucose-6-phosphate isomerase
VSKIIPASGHPGIWLGVLMGYLAKKGHNKLGLLFADPLASFANWVEQLVAESTGKEGVGVLPVVAGTIGKPHDYDDDRFLINLHLVDTPDERNQKVKALQEAGHPVLNIELEDAYDLGGEFIRWEFGTAVAGHVLGINPFDEPNVTESKENTGKLLDYYQKNGSLPVTEPFFEEAHVALYVDANMGEMLSKICEQRNYSDTELAGILAAHISFARSGDYIAMMAYLEPTPAHDDILADLRRRLRHATTRAITLGYGPRFLHSTGQFHKGGPADGIFIQITVDDALDLDIPGLPFSFGVLKAAQAAGDQQALMQRELPFVRLHIKGDIPAGLATISEAVKVAEEKHF